MASGIARIRKSDNHNDRERSAPVSPPPRVRTRLEVAARAVVITRPTPLNAIFGWPDDKTSGLSMTLFAAAADDAGGLSDRVLARRAQGRGEIGLVDRKGRQGATAYHDYRSAEVP